jgi:uncharacterized protein DUF5666
MAIPRIAALASLLLLAFSFVGTKLPSSPHASAAVLAQDDTNFTLEGKITEKSAGKLTVSSGENMIFHVLYNDKTEIKKKDGNPGTGQDLRTGVKISVAGDLAESGEITAKKIEIEGEGSEKQ